MQRGPAGDAKDPQATSSEPEASEGWESLAGEPPGRSHQAEAQADEAMREAGQASEPGDPPPGAPPGDEPVDLLDGAQHEIEAMKDRLLRLQADFENYRRRVLKEREDAFNYGHENLVKDLLAPVDNLERAIELARKRDGGDLEGFLQGVELVLRELNGILAKHGVSEIVALGQTFDPNVHEAMAQEPAGGSEPNNTVTQVLEKGYRLRDRLLRPARVVVARRREEEPGG